MSRLIPPASRDRCRASDLSPSSAPGPVAADSTSRLTSTGDTLVEVVFCLLLAESDALLLDSAHACATLTAWQVGGSCLAPRSECLIGSSIAILERSTTSRRLAQASCCADNAIIGAAVAAAVVVAIAACCVRWLRHLRARGVPSPHLPVPDQGLSN